MAIDQELPPQAAKQLPDASNMGTKRKIVCFSGKLTVMDLGDFHL